MPWRGCMIAYCRDCPYPKGEEICFTWVPDEQREVKNRG